MLQVYVNISYMHVLHTLCDKYYLNVVKIAPYVPHKVFLNVKFSANLQKIVLRNKNFAL